MTKISNTEMPQDLLVRLGEYWEYDTDHLIKSAITCISEQQDENDRLRNTLGSVMQTLAFNIWGECRGWSDGKILTVHQAADAARTALQEISND